MKQNIVFKFPFSLSSFRLTLFCISWSSRSPVSFCSQFFFPNISILFSSLCSQSFQFLFLHSFLSSLYSFKSLLCFTHSCLFPLFVFLLVSSVLFCIPPFSSTLILHFSLSLCLPCISYSSLAFCVFPQFSLSSFLCLVSSIPLFLSLSLPFIIPFIHIPSSSPPLSLLLPYFIMSAVADFIPD